MKKKLITLTPQKWDELKAEGFFIPKNDFDITKYVKNTDVQKRIVKFINFDVLISELPEELKIILLSKLLEHLINPSATDLAKISLYFSDRNNIKAAEILDGLVDYYWEKQGLKERTNEDPNDYSTIEVARVQKIVSAEQNDSDD